MSRWQDLVDNYPRAVKVLFPLRAVLPPLNFITIHYAYFIVVCLLSSVIFWASSNPAASISFTDSLFLVVSAMTEAGLNTVNLSQITTWQQTLLFLLIVLGSSIWVSIWTVVARKNAFERRFHDIVRAERMRRANRGGGSTLSLPRLQRFISFRKAPLSAPVPSPMLPIGKRPSSVDRQHQPGPVVQGPDPAPSPVPVMASVDPKPADIAPTGDDAVAAGTERSTSNSAEKYVRVVPSSPGHIAFADDVGSNAQGNRAAAISSSTELHAPESRPSRRTAASVRRVGGENEKRELDMAHFLAFRSVGRNGQFHDLTAEERDRLGGCEYRALKVLAVVVPLYFFLWQSLGCIALGAWIHNNQPGPPLANGINPWWLGIFNGASAFNNSGMSLLDANMIPFQKSTYVLITMGLLILAGNTAYPIFLRLIIWSMLHILDLVADGEELGDLKDTLRFILQYPRRVYTNLFPSRPTWWLVFMLVLLNSIDWVAFELLNLGNPAIESIPTGSRVLDGLFQALAVRSGGFYVVPIPSTYIGLQVLYVIMMYISVYPVVVTMRHSNVYEERSLGIYRGDDHDDNTTDPEMDPQPGLLSYSSQSGSNVGIGGDDGTASTSGYLNPSWSARPGIAHRVGNTHTAATLGRALDRTFTWHGVGAQPPIRTSHGPESRISFISHQIRGQLAHDIWWLVLAILAIVTIETSNFLADPVTFSVFNVIFEVVSAYGCVGISVGLPDQSYSFCGSWHVASKLVLCVVMIRGRHRGLPVALDRAVRLPGERLHREEEEDYRIRRSMTNRRVSVES